MLKIEIQTDNAAFDDAPHIEAARILRKLADSYEFADLARGKEPPISLRDVNGNVVGKAEWLED